MLTASPHLYCPFCGTPLNVMDTIPAISSEGIHNMSICICGELDVIIRQNKPAAVQIRNPDLHPDIRIISE